MAAMAVRRSGLWHNGDFLRLWSGQSVSSLGSQVSLLAIPFAAVVLLHVSAFQAGLLGTAEYLPWLLVGLPAGVVVDRLPRRSVLIAADAGRAVVFASVPAAWWVGHLTVVQLYAVAFVAGILTVFFYVAYQSYLPELVGIEHLVEGNSKLETTSSAASVAGPTIGGALVAGVGAAVSVLADAVSYVVSVVMLLSIRRRERPLHDADAPPGPLLRGMRRDIVEGLRFLVGHPLLRPIVFCSAAANLFLDMVLALVVLFAVRDLGMSSTAVGLAFSVGSLALVAGAAGAPRIAARIGTGPTIAGSAMLFTLAFAVLALAPRAHPFWFIAAQSGLTGFAAVVYNVNQVSLRQAVTPSRLRGRVNATNRFVVYGVSPVGTFVGGVLGSALGLRTTFWIAAGGLALPSLLVVFSPVVRLRRIEDAFTSPGAGDEFSAALST
jgi:MFS family permease